MLKGVGENPVLSAVGNISLGYLLFIRSLISSYGFLPRFVFYIHMHECMFVRTCERTEQS